MFLGGASMRSVPLQARTRTTFFSPTDFLNVLNDLGFKDFFAAYSGKLAMDFIAQRSYKSSLWVILKSLGLDLVLAFPLIGVSEWL